MYVLVSGVAARKKHARGTGSNSSPTTPAAVRFQKTEIFLLGQLANLTDEIAVTCRILVRRLRVECNKGTEQTFCGSR
jgi:hypothetical protein